MPAPAHSDPNENRPHESPKDVRLENVARTLGLSITELESIIVHNATRKIFPRNFNEKHLVKAIDIIRSEAFADGSARIELKNGRVFWGPREGQSEALCRLLRNMLPKLIVPGAYGAGLLSKPICATLLRFVRPFSKQRYGHRGWG